MHLDYYKSLAGTTKKKSRQEIEIKDGVKLYRFTRYYKETEGAKAVFYTTTGVLYRQMYISIGPSLQKLVESYVLVTEKCTKSSVKKAFQNCPNLVKWIKRYLKDSSFFTPITVLQLSDTEHEFCLRTDYGTIFTSKRYNYRELTSYANIICNESKMIDKSALQIKPTFAQKLRKVAKYVIRIGVIGLGVMIGADLDLPDFDFDFDLPDVDIDIDVPDLDVLPIDPTGMSLEEAQASLESVTTYEYVTVPDTDLGLELNDSDTFSEASSDDLYSHYEDQKADYLANREKHIDSIYDPQIEAAENKLKADTERIAKDGPYSWENGEATLKKDRNRIEELINDKKQAISQAKVDAGQMAHWDSVSKHTKETLSQKIG